MREVCYCRHPNPTRRTLRQIAQQLPAKGFGTSSTETPGTQNHHPRESQLQDLLPSVLGLLLVSLVFGLHLHRLIDSWRGPGAWAGVSEA